MTIFLQNWGEKAIFLVLEYSCLRQFQLIMLAMLSKICQTRGNLQFQLMMLADGNKDHHHLVHILPLKQIIPQKWLISSISMNGRAPRHLELTNRSLWADILSNSHDTAYWILWLIGFYDYLGLSGGGSQNQIIPVPVKFLPACQISCIIQTAAFETFDFVLNSSASKLHRYQCIPRPSSSCVYLYCGSRDNGHLGLQLQMWAP